MKSKKWLLLLISIISLLLLCAFAVIPSIRLSDGKGQIIDVSYRAAQASKDSLTLSVDYSSAGTFFEIGRDIVVSTDPDFTAPLRLKNCTENNGTYRYEFRISNAERLKTVYIQPPILYVPAEITPITLPLTKGQTAKLSTEAAAFQTAGINWFSIDTISIEPFSDGVYAAKIVVDAIGADLPRFPKLTIGQNQLGGISALSFDEKDRFQSGEFLFYIHAASQADAALMLSAASLTVSDALIRVDTEKLAFSSDIKSLSVVISDIEK